MMSLSKLWLFLTTLISGLLLLAFLLSPAYIKRALGESANARIELAQQSANLMLQNSARRWIDSATQLAGDPVIQGTLEELGRGQSEFELVHKTAQRHLQKMNETLKASFIILTDARGRVLCRVGKDEATYRDLIEGFPIVADALRGYRLDDLWYFHGDLYRMAAAPVIGQDRAGYVGSVVLAQAVDDDFARRLHKSLGVDVAFTCNDRIIAASRPAEKLPQSALLQLFHDREDVIRAGGHTQAQAVGPDKDELVLLSGLPGEAATQGAALFLLGTQPAGTSLSSLLPTLVEILGTSDFFSDQQLTPLGLGLAAVFLAFFIGLLLLRVEAEAPYNQLLLELSNIARKRVSKMQEKHFSRFWRDLALAINAALRSVRPEGQEDAEPPSQDSAPSKQSGLAPEDLIKSFRTPPGPGPTPPPPASGASLDAQRLPSLSTLALPPEPVAPMKVPPPLVTEVPELSKLQLPAAGIAAAPPPRSEPQLSALVPDEAATLRATLPRIGTVPAPAIAVNRPAVVEPAPVGPQAALRNATTGPIGPKKTDAGPAAAPQKTGRGIPVPAMARPAAADPKGSPPPLPGGMASSSKTIQDPNLEAMLMAEDRSTSSRSGAEVPTVRDIPGSVVQQAIENALMASPASYAGPVPAGVLRPRPATGPISSAAPPQARRGNAPAQTAEVLSANAHADLGSTVTSRSLFEEPTAVGKNAPAEQGETEEEMEAAFQKTYQEFVVTKQRCNEPVEGLTFDKFVVKLRQSREQIMRQHNCKSVRFFVYVKDGKAALKATPVAR